VAWEDFVEYGGQIKEEVVGWKWGRSWTIETTQRPTHLGEKKEMVGGMVRWPRKEKKERNNLVRKWKKERRRTWRGTYSKRNMVHRGSNTNFGDSQCGIENTHQSLNQKDNCVRYVGDVMR
jgi:hypothetical protein